MTGYVPVDGDESLLDRSVESVHSTVDDMTGLPKAGTQQPPETPTAPESWATESQLAMATDQVAALSTTITQQPTDDMHMNVQDNESAADGPAE